MKRILVIAAIILAISGVVGLYPRNSASAQISTVKSANDTVPKSDIKDLDKALEELDKAKLELEIQLSKKDWEKVEKEVREAMQKVDVEKIKLDVQKAINDIDVEKIRAEVAASLKEIDDVEIKAKVQASIAKVDLDKMKAELEKVKMDDLKKMEAELKNIRPEIEKAMKEAKVNIEKAKREIQEYKEFINQLDKDGLIDKDAHFEVEHKDGVLTVNGKVQPAEVYNRYRKFLEKHKKFHWENDGHRD